jgi:predicted TIM-barrel fold metal-dependent hydrolase
VAVRPQTVTSINTFIAETIAQDDQLVGFMTLHQDFEDPAAEIDRAVSMGLRGVKLHPDTQEVNLDDERLMRIYEICERKGLPVMLHCGDYRYDYSHPRRLKNVLHAFPGLVVDAAHFGGWSVYDLALEYLEDERCFLDVSSSMRYLGSRRTRELCDLYGHDRILFGSDYPMWNPTREHAIFRAIGFSERGFEAMCWHNAERFVGTDIGR